MSTVFDGILGKLRKKDAGGDQDLSGLVPKTRTITVNGVTQDLTSDVSYDVSAGSGGYAANVYLQSTASTTVPSYKALSYVPELAASTISASPQNNEVLLGTFQYDADVDTTIVDAGEWGFHFHTQVSTAVGATTLRFVPYKRSAGGVETDLFSFTSTEINSTTAELVSFLITQPAFTVNATDRLGLKVYAATTHSVPVTVTVTVGDGNASYFTTPLAIRHSQLRARDGADAHPISAITNLQPSLDGKVPTSRTLTINGETYDLSANRSWTISASGGAVAQIQWAGPLVAGTLLARVTATSAKTLSYVKASLGVLNTGASVLIDVRKNGTATTNSIFTSDSPLEITTGTSATNGVYTVTKTAIDNGSVVENNTLYVFVTQVGSGVAGADLYLEIN